MLKPMLAWAFPNIWKLKLSNYFLFPLRVHYTLVVGPKALLKVNLKVSKIIPRGKDN